MNDDADARIGKRIAGKLRIEARIGAGAAGVVYRAFQETLQRSVALKLLTSLDDNAVRRFEREGAAMAKLRHENVVAIFNLGRTDDGIPYIAMEHIDGGSLRSLLDARELEVGEALSLARGIASALAHAHAASVVHRDLKPENVMLVGGRTDAHSVRVVDFGLAAVHVEGALTNHTTAIQGTPAYMSPEQIDAVAGKAAAGPPCDVYALGVVLYEMLTGANPFRAESGLKSLLRHVEGPVPPPPSIHRAGLDPRLDALVLSMLQKDPAARPTSPSVARALDDLALQRATAVAPTPEATPVGRRPLLVALSIAAVVAVLATIAITSSGGSRAHVNASVSTSDAGGSGSGGSGSGSGGGAFAADAGTELASVVVVDAGARAEELPVHREAATATVHTRQTTQSARIDAGVVAVDVAHPTAPASARSPLERKAYALAASCTEPCAADLARAFGDAAAQGLASLKSWRESFDACSLRCSTHR